MAEKIQIVDSRDTPIGVATRQEAWAKGLYYRLVQIVLRDEHGNFLLQKRSPLKALYPDRWTNAASGHVDEGETYELSAQRELHEEIGMNTPLEYVGKVLIQLQDENKSINQFNGVFIGHIPQDTHFKLDPNEVSAVQWFTKQELQDKTIRNPEQFTPAVVEILRQFYF